MSDATPTAPRRIRYDEAARRHHADAQLLHDRSRRANADHLYGISTECALLGLLRSSPQSERLFDADGRVDAKYTKHVNALWHQFCSDAQGYRLGGALSAMRAAFPDEPKFPGHRPQPQNPFRGWSVDQRYLSDAAADAEVPDEALKRHKDAAEVVLRLLDSHKVAP